MRVRWKHCKLNPKFILICLVIFIICIIILSVSLSSICLNCVTCAEPSEFPHHVSIRFGKNHHCSGGLISRRHVLTAAQCVDVEHITPKPTIKVVVGSTHLACGIFYSVASIALHPSYRAIITNYTIENHLNHTLPMYNFVNKTNDVAVVRLKEVVILSEFVRIIALPRPGMKVYHDQKLLISFFGHDRLFPKQDLRRADLTKYEVTVKTDHHCDYPYLYFGLAGKFCGIVEIRPCPPKLFDLGSLAILNKKYVIGIFSNIRRSTCSITNADLFTHVSEYLDFIISEMRRS